MNPHATMTNPKAEAYNPTKVGRTCPVGEPSLREDDSQNTPKGFPGDGGIVAWGFVYPVLPVMWAGRMHNGGQASKNSLPLASAGRAIPGYSEQNSSVSRRMYLRASHWAMGRSCRRQLPHVAGVVPGTTSA